MRIIIFLYILTMIVSILLFSDPKPPPVKKDSGINITTMNNFAEVCSQNGFVYYKIPAYGRTHYTYTPVFSSQTGKAMTCHEYQLKDK